MQASSTRDFPFSAVKRTPTKPWKAVVREDMNLAFLNVQGVIPNMSYTLEIEASQMYSSTVASVYLLLT